MNQVIAQNACGSKRNTHSVQQQWNATAAASWDHFATHFPITELLGIVPLTAHVRSGKEASRGKFPGYCEAEGTWHGRSGEGANTTRDTTAYEIANWRKEAPDSNVAGVGILGRNFPCYDNDAEDAGIGAAIEQLLREKIPGMPRRGRDGDTRAAFMFRAETGAQLKGSFRYVLPNETRLDERGNKVSSVFECRGYGMYWNLAGPHKSGKLYSWDRFPKENDLPPAVSAAQHEAVFEAVQQLVIDRGCTIVKRSGRVVQYGDAVVAAFAEEPGKHARSMDALVSVLEDWPDDKREWTSVHDSGHEAFLPLMGALMASASPYWDDVIADGKYDGMTVQEALKSELAKCWYISTSRDDKRVDFLSEYNRCLHNLKGTKTGGWSYVLRILRGEDAYQQFIRERASAEAADIADQAPDTLAEDGKSVGIDPGDPASPGYALRVATIRQLAVLADFSDDVPEEYRDAAEVQVVPTSLVPAKYLRDDGSIKWPDAKVVGEGENKRSVPLATCLNTRIAIEALGIECSYDAFHDRQIVGGHAIAQQAGELSDGAVLMLRAVIRDQFGFDPGTNHAFDAARQLCMGNTFDPVLTYLDGLRWDGVKRLDRWLQTYMGAEDTELNRWFGRLIMIAAVRRVREPGTKFDQIVVFESPEGYNKSTAIRLLAGAANFSDQTILGKSDKEQMELLQGCWLYEIAELSGISKADIEAVKAFASRSVDRARPAYGRCVVERPRRCVLFATTNDREYLKSPTGNRRMWPVAVTRIDIDALARDRDQLWAEAAALEAAGASIGLPEHLWAEAAAVQESRRESHPWEDVLAEVKGEVKGGSMFVTSAALFAKLDISVDRQNGAQGKLVGQIMRRFLWSGPERFRVEGRLVRGFRRKATPEEIAVAEAEAAPW